MPSSSSTRMRKFAARVGIASPVVELVLLQREAHAVRVAATLDRRRLAIPREPADRRPVAHELLVVELRPAEPLPPLRPLLALVVLEQVGEQQLRVAGPGIVAQHRLHLGPFGLALDCRLGGLAQAGRLAPGRLLRPDRQQPLVQRHGRPAVLLVVALDVHRARVSSPVSSHSSKRTTDSSPPDDRGRTHEAVQLLDRLDRVALHRGAERLLDDAVEVDEHLVA